MTKWMRALAVALVVPALAACDKDPEEPGGHAEDVALVRLTVGTQVVTINSGAVVTGGPLVLAAGTATPVSATFLTPTNATVSLGSDFRLDLTPDNSGRVTFSRTGAFTGILTGNSAGSASFSVGIFHTAEGHTDWGGANHRISVTVQ